MSSDVLAALRQCAGMPLPADYEAFLGDHDGTERFRDPRERDLEWELWSLGAAPASSPLLQCVMFSGKHIPRVLSIRHALSEAVRFQKRDLAVVGGGSFASKDVNHCIAVGSAAEDSLFLMSDGSVWCFWHATLEVEKRAPSWAEWIESSRRSQERTEDHAPSSGDIAVFVGYWVPKASKLYSDRVVSRKCKYEILGNGECLSHDFFGDTESWRWTVRDDDSGRQLVLSGSDGERVYDVPMVDDETMVLIGPNGARGDLTYKKTHS